MDQIKISKSDLEKLAVTLDGPQIAEMLGISKPVLYRICEKHGIEVKKPKGGRPPVVVVVD